MDKLKPVSAGVLDIVLSVITDKIGVVEKKLSNGKQDKVIGSEGQIIGFDADGNTIAQDIPDTSPRMTIVTLTAAGWDSNALNHSVTVTGILADETKQLIQCTPAGASMSAAAEAGIYCSAQGANTLTFTCTEVPTADVQFCVSWQDATYVS